MRYKVHRKVIPAIHPLALTARSLVRYWAAVEYSPARALFSRFDDARRRNFVLCLYRFYFFFLFFISLTSHTRHTIHGRVITEHES